MQILGLFSDLWNTLHMSYWLFIEMSKTKQFKNEFIIFYCLKPCLKTVFVLNLHLVKSGILEMLCI